MAVTTTQLAEYLRLPPDTSEDLNIYLSAAQSKARSAGVPAFDNNAQYDLMLLTLAAMYYENRGATFSGSYQATAEGNARRIINSFVLELRHAKEDGEVE